MKKTTFRGIASISAGLMALLMMGSMIAYENYGMIDTALNVSRTETVNADGSDASDTMYYKSEYADSMSDITSKSKTLKLEQAVAEYEVKVVEEGSVLLKNDNNALPLEQGEAVTLFGNAACGMEDGHNHMHLSKKKDASSLDGIPTVWFDDAMESQFNVNRAVIDNCYSYEAMWHAGTNANRCTCYNCTPQEGYVYAADDPTYAVELQESSWSSGTEYYGGVAIVNFFRWASEGREGMLYQDPTDTPFTTGSNTDNGGRHKLALSKNEEDLLKYLKEQKDEGKFSKVIVCISSDLGMELDFLEDEEYGVDACIKVGIPGNTGYTGLANILCGEATPSGHLIDTYAADMFSAPSTVGASYLSPEWENWSSGEVLNLSSDASKDGSASDANQYYSIYGAGVYLGYKYYESRYSDSLTTPSSNATSTMGSTTGSAWNYADEVCYPFGYGMSYTTFSQTIDSVTYNSETDNYEVKVTVRNTGDYAGKSVVEVYAQTPYGTYEQENNVEVPTIQLAAFDKTGTLEPGESQTLTVEVKQYLLAHYDTFGAEGYILSGGQYYLAIGEDAHDAMNNILAYQGVSGLTDQSGNSVSGDSSKVYAFDKANLDTATYNESVYGTGVEVTNQFSHADINNYAGQSYTYLSRTDYEGTYPTAEKQVVSLTKEMAVDMDCDWYENEDNMESSDWYQDVGANYADGLTNNQATSHASDYSDVETKFVEMKDVSWEDDEKWEAFLDQFTVDELVSLYPDNNGYSGVAAIGVPSACRGDDGTCVLQAKLKAFDTDGLAWPSEAVVSSTWSKEVFERKAELVAEQAIFSDCQEIWWGAGNMHQVPWGGRNMQYFSEDPVLSYYGCAYEAKGCQSKGIAYCVKHAVLNDTEAHRESTATFCTEQALRETYLKSFEGCLMEGGGMGVMMGFNRVGLKFCPTDYNLMTKVMKGEWGWTGHITTDADSGIAVKDHYLEQLIAGTDYTCWEQTAGPSAITSAINGGDNYVLSQMRRAAKATIYTDLRTIAVNGLTADTIMRTVTPAWQIAVITVDIVVGVVFIASCAAYIYMAYIRKEQ